MRKTAGRSFWRRADVTINIELLDGCRPFEALPRDAKQALADAAREVRFEAGERLVSLLEPPSRLFIVLEGMAKMVGVSAAGVERILSVFRPCEIIGSRALLNESDEASYEIVAMDSVRALSIGKSDVLAAGRDHPEILIAVTQEFSRRLEQLMGRMLAAMSDEVPVRLGKLLLDFANVNGAGADAFVPLEYPLTHEAMAQIIGASRPHTSTVLRDLEEKGAVQRRSEDGLLVQPARLEEIVSSEGAAPPRDQ
ncbi:MAG: Crp/Fnr family transcriptional regulator [Gemmatimonadetes bacterium]|nr:Crp/Fnr family transcriptional regulator [Gemmatimonadota bacterium]